MPGNETKRPSKWWFWAFPALGTSYVLLVVLAALSGDWFFSSRLGPTLLWPLKVIYVCWTGSSRLMPIVVWEVAWTVLGLAIYCLMFKALRRAVVPIFLLLVLAAALLLWTPWAARAAPGPLARWRAMLGEIKYDSRSRQWEYLWREARSDDLRTRGSHMGWLFSKAVRRQLEELGTEGFLTSFEARSKEIEDFGLTSPGEYFGQAGDFTLFEHAVAYQVVHQLVASDDRESLVRMLSLYCPAVLGPPTMGSFVEEFVLGFRPDLKRILVLCDVYERSERPDVRAVIVVALRRAFPMVDDEGPGDQAFVRACRQWYLEHKGRLVLNPDYEDWYGPDTPLFLVVEPQETK